MEQPPDHRESGVPPLWSSYVAVDDVDAATARAGELGGSVELDPMEVAEAGRMSVVRDPTGGVVFLWETAEKKSGLYNEPGSMIWNELATRDADRAVEFYSELLGWEFETSHTHGTTYHVIKNAGRDNCGILQMTDEWPDEIPGHWMVYFEVGIMSVVGDPQGGTFTLFENRRETPAA